MLRNEASPTMRRCCFSVTRRGQDGIARRRSAGAVARPKRLFEVASAILPNQRAVDYGVRSARAISVISVAPMASAWRMASRMSKAVTTRTATKLTWYLTTTRLAGNGGVGFGRGMPGASRPEDGRTRPTLDPGRAVEPLAVSCRREARVAVSFLRPRAG